MADRTTDVLIDVLERLASLVEAGQAGLTERLDQPDASVVVGRARVLATTLRREAGEDAVRFGASDTISPDGVAVPGAVPGARVVGGVPLVDVIARAAAAAAVNAARGEVVAVTAPATRLAEQVEDAQVYRVMKQGRGDGRD